MADISRTLFLAECKATLRSGKSSPVKIQGDWPFFEFVSHEAVEILFNLGFKPQKLPESMLLTDDWQFFEVDWRPVHPSHARFGS